MGKNTIAPNKSYIDKEGSWIIEFNAKELERLFKNFKAKQTPKEKIQAEIDWRIDEMTNLQIATDKDGYYIWIKDIKIENAITSLKNKIKGLQVALTHLK
jgi:hypothetical protein